MNLKTIFKDTGNYPIAYYPILSRITGNLVAGVLLSQIIYWNEKQKDMMFYKTDKDFCNELQIGKYQIKSAKKILTDLGVISILLKGIPRKTHYRLNANTLQKLVIATFSTTDVGKTNISSVDESTAITETTQETTLETNNNSFFEKKGNDLKIENIETFLKTFPSDDENVNLAIHLYLQLYKEKLNKDHPRISYEQYEKVKCSLESPQPIHDEYDYNDSADLKNIIKTWFEDHTVKSDYNIIHFASGKIVPTGYFRNHY